MDTGVVRGLRAHGIDVMTASEVGMICRPDEQHLTFAAAQQRTLYSFNVRDLDDGGPGSRGHHPCATTALLDWGANPPVAPANRLGSRRGHEEPPRVLGQLVAGVQGNNF